MNNKQSPLIKDVVFQTITEAIRQSAQPEQSKSYIRLAERLFNSLPPIASSTSIVSVARDVLLGSGSARREFQAFLDDMRAWGSATGGCGAVLPPLESDGGSLVPDEYLQRWTNDAKSSRQFESIYEEESLVTLIGAAMYSSDREPISLNDNLGAILNPLCGLSRLEQLYQRAADILRGRGFPPGFLNTLALLNGIPGEVGDQPPIGEPMQPGALPWGGGSPCWPPSRRGRPGIRGGAECIAEAIRVFLTALETDDALNYRIDRIDPPHACPGDTLRIEGEGFSFRGADEGLVRFNGSNARTPVVVPASSWSDTLVEVVVPEEAYCGPLELGLSEPIVLLACDREVRLDLSAGTESVFLGGKTRVTQLSFARPADGRCFTFGDRVRFLIETCNADSLTFQITDIFGETTFLDRTYDGGIPRSISFDVPSFSQNQRLLAVASVTGRCGTDRREAGFSVRSDTPLPMSERADYDMRLFRNWNENISRSVPQFEPQSLDALVGAVRTIQEMSDEDGIERKLAVAGSGFSFTECVLPMDAPNYYLIDTCSLHEILQPPSTSSWEFDDLRDGSSDPTELREALLSFTSDRESFLQTALRDDITSVIPAEALSQYSAVVDTVTPIEARLTHIECGIKIKTLNYELDQIGMALPTMGGGDGQSIFGVLSTGSHGSTNHLPPIADFVRAIHLVGPGGQQWWIEPLSKPITDRRKMERLRGIGLDPCIRIEYDDNLFYSVLVSMGTAGIAYSIVYEVIDAHRMRYNTVGQSWADAQDLIRTNFLDGRPSDKWWTEIIVHPDWFGIERNWVTRVSECVLTTEDLDCQPADLAITGSSSFAEKWIVHGATSLFMTTFIPWLAQQVALIVFYLGTFQWGKMRRVARTVQTVRQLWDAVVGSQRLIESDLSEETFYREAPNIINAAWEISKLFPGGQVLFELVQQQMTTDMRKDRNDVLKSYHALMSQPLPVCDDGLPAAESPPDVTCPSPWDAEEEPDRLSNGFERLVESHEYVLPVSRCIPFVNALIEAANDIRLGLDGDALLVTFPMRFTRPTSAKIGMQRPSHDICCHVEVFSLERLNGYREFYRQTVRIANDFGAIPHWGQLHSPGVDFDALYGFDLANWRLAIHTIARESGGNPETFSSEFAINRRLLP